MSWIRNLLQLFFSHPTMGPQLIQRLSETRPIRAAARATAYVYLRGKQAIEESAAKDAARDAAGRFGASGEAAAGRGGRFFRNFQKELKKGMREKLK